MSSSNICIPEEKKLPLGLPAPSFMEDSAEFLVAVMEDLEDMCMNYINQDNGDWSQPNKGVQKQFSRICFPHL